VVRVRTIYAASLEALQDLFPQLQQERLNLLCLPIFFSPLRLRDIPVQNGLDQQGIHESTRLL
jgi:hypothetical protein